MKTKIFYMSDLHFCHFNIIRLCNRPYKSTEEMNEDIVSKWNSVVGKNDIVYIAGDVGFPKNLDQVAEIISLVKRLNGKKFLIEGNHDHKLVRDNNFSYLFEEISPYMRIKDQNRDVVICHYPIEEWDGLFRGSYHIYGHVHNNKGNLKFIPNRFNVSSEVIDYTPKTLDELIELNSRKNITEDKYEVELNIEMVRKYADFLGYEKEEYMSDDFNKNKDILYRFQEDIESVIMQGLYP